MRLKWKSIRVVVLLATVILGMSTVFIYLSVTGRTSGDEAKAVSQFFVPPMALWGQEASLDQAQAWMPFKIRLPTNLGNFAELRIDRSINGVLVVYAADKPSNDATVEDVLDQDGIIFLELPNTMTLQDAAQNTRDAINATDGRLQPVDINGYFGAAGGNVWHCVSWYAETTYYRLIANIDFPLQQLIEIARTIPVD